MSLGASSRHLPFLCFRMVEIEYSLDKGISFVNGSLKFIGVSCVSTGVGMPPCVLESPYWRERQSQRQGMETMSPAGPECSVGRQAAERHLTASSRPLALHQGAVALLRLGKYPESASTRSFRVQPAVQALQDLCSSDDCFS